MIYVVSFQYSESTYCSNVAIADSKQDVERVYSKYAWYSISEGTEADLQEAQRKNKPIIECEHIEEAAESATDDLLTISSYQYDVLRQALSIIEYGADNRARVTCDDGCFAREEKPMTFGVNWAACGCCTTEETHEMIAHLQTAARIAAMLNACNISNKVKRIEDNKTREEWYKDADFLTKLLKNGDLSTAIGFLLSI